MFSLHSVSLFKLVALTIRTHSRYRCLVHRICTFFRGALHKQMYFNLILLETLFMYTWNKKLLLWSFHVYCLLPNCPHVKFRPKIILIYKLSYLTQETPPSLKQFVQIIETFKYILREENFFVDISCINIYFCQIILHYSI